MVLKTQDMPNRAAFDVRSSQDLREQLRNNPQAGLKAAAQQFETLFLQMVLKSMRDTVPSDGLMNSDQTRFYNGLLDQQMAQNLATSGKGVGFAQLIERQLGGALTSSADALSMAGDEALSQTAASFAGNNAALPRAGVLQYRERLSGLPTSADYAASTSIHSARRGVESGESSGGAREFVDGVWPDAVAASRSTGIPPQFLVAHAALESGWGKREILREDGSSSHNIFGIKAGQSWRGDSATTQTTEYVGGVAQVSNERFRAYASYGEAFQDYAKLLRNNPRYSEVIGSQNGTEFARRLQQAGYATDPMYAEKLARIIDGPTLRQALIG